MPWMTRYAGPFPLFLSWAQGARVQDVDGHTYLDFALGATGAMTGHSPGAVVTELLARLLQGLTAMLPTEDALWVAEERSQRVGRPCWKGGRWAPWCRRSTGSGGGGLWSGP